MLDAMTKWTLLVYLPMMMELMSCVEELAWQERGPATNRLVVEGSITTERKAHTVNLSRTTPAIPTEAATGVSGAIVSIVHGTTRFPLYEVDTIPGLYRTDSTVVGEVGQTYTLQIELGPASYSATTTIEPVLDFESPALLFASPNRLGNPIRGNLTVFELEFPKVRYGAATPVRDIFSAQEPIGLQWMSAFYYQFPGIDPEGFLLNFSGANQTLLLQAGTVITQTRYSLTDSHYRFIRDVYAETQFRGGVFDRMPANVKGNISNGALGFFSGSQVAQRSFVVQKSWLGQ
ncbi:MAG: hypothetical protein BGO59_09240 [Spirosoma sp. 48-14]|nr:MAG: hypothetical protein BGO59_09240 [Spirosoma sp. 48-14]